MTIDLQLTIPDGWKLIESTKNAQMGDKYWDYVLEAWMPVLVNEHFAIRPSLLIRREK